MGEIPNTIEPDAAGSSVTRIFVSGLPPSMTTEQLRSHFSSKFTVTDAHVVPERRIGFIGFMDNESATSAVKYFNRSFVKMSKISVTLAKPVEVKRDASGQAAPVSLRRSGRRQETEEYESKKRKREAHDDGETVRQQASPKAQIKQDPKIQTDAADATREELASADSPQTGAPDAQGSDSDWLRGKTSRLLDLVEEDALDPDAFQTGAAAAINQTTETSHVGNGKDITKPSPDEGGGETTAISIPNARLFIRNLPFNTSHDSLRTTFSPYGRISEVR